MVSGFSFAYGAFIAFLATRCSPLSREPLVPYKCLAAELTLPTPTALVKARFTVDLSRPISRFQWFQVVLRRCERGWHTEKKEANYVDDSLPLFQWGEVERDRVAYGTFSWRKPFIPGCFAEMMVGEMFRQTSCY